MLLQVGFYTGYILNWQFMAQELKINTFCISTTLRWLFGDDIHTKSHDRRCLHQLRCVAQQKVFLFLFMTACFVEYCNNDNNKKFLGLKKLDCYSFWGQVGLWPWFLQVKLAQCRVSFAKSVSTPLLSHSVMLLGALTITLIYHEIMYFKRWFLYTFIHDFYTPKLCTHITVWFR